MLANRDTWMKMRGSPELVMYSMHLDSLTMMTAYKLGIRMEELPSEMVHYHIEHGNGWTPDQGLQLYRRMNGCGVRILTYGQYCGTPRTSSTSRTIFCLARTGDWDQPRCRRRS